jgi:hypothetical protein
MNLRRIRRKLSALLFVVVVTTYYLAPIVMPAREIALTIGEPWEDMRQRSSARIGEAIPGHIWFSMPDTDASLRFIDPQYGYTTPPARFFTVSFENERVQSVHMSPQVEPLLLDDAMKVVMDIEKQLVAGGWVNIFPDSDPTFVDTPEWRATLRNAPNGVTTYWHAEDKYQVLLIMHRFRDSKRPKEERYLITLNMAAPWTPREDTPFLPLQPETSEKVTAAAANMDTARKSGVQ